MAGFIGFKTPKAGSGKTDPKAIKAMLTRKK